MEIEYNNKTGLPQLSYSQLELKVRKQNQFESEAVIQQILKELTSSNNTIRDAKEIYRRNL